MLNYKCFEKIALKSNSDESHRIHQYFIELREFIFNNSKLIEQSLNTHEILINTTSIKKYNDNYSVLYFFAVDKKYENIFKVGSTYNIINRIKSYNVGRINDIDIKYAVVVYNGKIIEQCIGKLLYRSKHIDNKEIYNI